jgi:hypothetical protein
MSHLRYEVIKLYIELNTLLCENNFNDIGNILFNVNIINSETITLLTYSRITYPARYKLKNWFDYVSKVAEELNKRDPIRAGK